MVLVSNTTACQSKSSSKAVCCQTTCTFLPIVQEKGSIALKLPTICIWTWLRGGGKRWFGAHNAYALGAWKVPGLLIIDDELHRSDKQCSKVTESETVHKCCPALRRERR